MEMDEEYIDNVKNLIEQKDAENVSVFIPSTSDSIKLNTPRKIGMFLIFLFLISPSYVEVSTTISWSGLRTATAYFS